MGSRSIDTIDLSHRISELFDDIGVGLLECLEMIRRQLAQRIADSCRANVLTASLGALPHAIGLAIVDGCLELGDAYRGNHCLAGT